ncbi:MAG: hypothetical protein HZA92_17140 [Verrucomicrobia bacterium]|nr:hypothetical protein [Verrucomicrobiota bacterium]
MNAHASLPRRAFLTSSARATAALSLGAASAFAVEEKPPRSFTVEATQVRGIAVSTRGELAVAADHAIQFYGLDGRRLRTVSAAQPVRCVAFDAQGRLFAGLKNQAARLGATGVLEPLGEPLGGRDSALTCLALADDGQIFAADSGERLIWRLAADGHVLGQIKPAAHGFTVPRAFFPIAWRNGQLIVADPGRHQIQTYAPDGRLLAKWGERSRDASGFAGCCNPVSFAALPDGTLVTAERGQPRVKLFNADGTLRRELAGPEQFAASLQAARAEADELLGCQAGLLDLAVSPRGAVVVLDRTTREVRVLA